MMLRRSFRCLVGWFLIAAQTVGPLGGFARPAVAQPVPPPVLRAAAQPFEAAAAALERYLEAVGAIRDSLGERPSIAAIVAREGASPEALFTHVRDNIRFEPYVGALRGVQGVLETGSGNAIDQALLLHALIASTGEVDVRLVHGLLEDASDDLVAQVFSAGEVFPTDRAPPVGPGPSASLAALLELPAETAQNAVSDNFAAFAELLDQLEDAAQEDARLVMQAAARAGVAPPDRALSAVERIAERTIRHAWVQYRDAQGDWIDLDPSFRGATAGRRFARDPVPLPLPLPADWRHTVTVTLTVERLKGGAIERDTLWSETLTGAEITTRPIAFELVPAGFDAGRLEDLALGREDVRAMLDASEAFQPVVRVGGVAEPAHPFDLDGTKRDVHDGALIAAPVAGAFDLFGGALGGIGGGEPEARLTGVWFDIEATSPDGSGTPVARRHRHVLLDRLAPGSRTGDTAPRIDPAFESEAALRTRLVLSGEIRMSGFTRSRAALFREWLDGVLEHGELLKGALALRYGRAAGLPRRSGEAPVPSAPVTQAWTLLSEEMAAARIGDPEVLRVFHDRPRIVALLTQLVSRDLSDPRVARSFDVIDNDLAAIGRDPAGTDAHAYRMIQGAADTVLEGWLLGEPEAATAHTLTIAALERGVALAAVDSDSADILGQTGLGANARARIERDLAGGYFVVVPSEEIDLGGAGGIHWWRYDPRTGDLIGRDGLGRGAAFSEYLSPSNVAKGAAFGIFVAHVVCAYVSADPIAYRTCITEAAVSEAIVFGGLLFFPGLAGFAGGALLAGGGLWMAAVGFVTDNGVLLGVGLGFAVPGIGHALASPADSLASPFLRRVAREIDQFDAANGARPVFATADAAAGAASRSLRNARAVADEPALMSRLGGELDDWWARVRDSFPRPAPKPPIRPYGRKVIYGRSTNLSEQIVARRKELGDFGGSNFAIIEWVTETGTRKTVIGRAPGFMKAGKHGEKSAWDMLPKYVRSDPSRITRLFTELEPCKSCRRFLEEVGVPRDVVRYSFDYPADSFLKRDAGKKAWRAALAELAASVQ